MFNHLSDTHKIYAGLIPDPRTKHLMYINAPLWLMAWVCVNFILGAKKLGPAVMKSREPYNLRTLMFFYNCFMSCINVYAVYRVIPMSNYFAILLNFDYPDRDDTSPEAIHCIYIGYLYWLSKIADCFDTLFFVLRKKYEQITLLHVYHHTVVPVFGFLLLRINPMLPCCYLFAFVNSMIHVIMYSYYALSALGPTIQQYLWWKKYITILQLWQFVLYGIYGAILFCFQRNYPIIWMFFALTQPPLFFWLFYDFYIKSYISRSSKRRGGGGGGGGRTGAGGGRLMINTTTTTTTTASSLSSSSMIGPESLAKKST